MEHLGDDPTSPACESQANLLLWKQPEQSRDSPFTLPEASIEVSSS